MKAASDLYIAGGKTLADLLGHEVKVFKDKKGVVVALVDAQSSDMVVKGTLKQTVTTDVYVEVSKDNVKSYHVLDTAVYYYNGSDVTKDKLMVGSDVAVYLDKDAKARFVVAYNYDVDDQQITSLVKGYDRTTITAGSGTNAKTFYGSNNTTVTLNGKAATLADLQKGDVVRVQFKPGSIEASVIEATRQVVEGRVVKKNTLNMTVDVDGATYAYVAGVELSVGTVYTLYFNADGKIVATTAKSAAQSGDLILTGKDKYAVLDGNKVVNVEEIKGMTFDGKAVTLTLGKLETGSVDYDNLSAGKVYTYTVTDGKVTAIVEKTTNGSDITVSAYDESTGAVKDNSGVQFYVTSETKLAIIKKDNGEVVGAETATASDLAGSTVQYVALKDKNGNVVDINGKAIAQYVLITKAAPSQTLTGIYYGMDEVYEDGKVVKYVELFNGTDKQKVKVTVSADAYQPGDLVKFSGTGYDTVTGANTKGKDTISVGSYSVTFGNQTYYFSAGAKIVLTIFDAKGNFVDVVPVSLSELSAYADGTTKLDYQAFTDGNFIQFLAVKVTQ